MANYFITGNGTDIGKTHIITSLCKHLKDEKNKRVMALKPLESGWSSATSDVAKILKALSLPFTEKNINLISYKRFKTPIAPNMAANMEGVELDFSKIVDFCNHHINKHDYLFIEGAGGIMSPLTNNTTYKDLLQALKIPVIFIAGSYLGTISHILTGLEALRDDKVQVIILNPYQHNNYVNIDDLQMCIQKFTDIPVIQYNDDLLLQILNKFLEL